jgi:hypothetical protein
VKAFFQVVGVLVSLAAMSPVLQTVLFNTVPTVRQCGAMILLGLAALILFGLGCDQKGGAA